MTTKPFLKWAGGKAKLVPFIYENFTVGRTGTSEYGQTEASVSGDSCLFGGTPDDQIVSPRAWAMVWKP